MPFLFRRILETFITSIICSAPFVMLIEIKFIPPTRIAQFFAILLVAALFLYINIRLLRFHITHVQNKAAFYRVNILVFFLYAAAVFLLIAFHQGVALAWGFLPVKFLQAAHVPTTVSAGIYCLLLFGSIVYISREYTKFQGMLQTMQEEWDELESDD